MARERRLNVYNSDRVYNIQLTTKQEINNYITITEYNKNEVEQKLNKLKEKSKRFNIKDENTYLIHQDQDKEISEKIINHGGFVYYYTKDKVPEKTIHKITQTPQSEIIYKCKNKHFLEDIQNVQKSFMATKVSVEVPIILPDMNPYDYLFSLHALRYNIDKVRIIFPELDKVDEHNKKYYFYYKGKYHLKSKYKYECFRHLREPLSTWKMNIILICDTEYDKNMVNELVVKNNTRFQDKKSKKENKNENRRDQNVE